MKKLPVLQSFEEVYAGVFTHFWDLMRVAWLPFIIWFVISFAANWWIVQHFLPNVMMNDAMADFGRDKFPANAAPATTFLKMMPQIYAIFFLQYLVMVVVAVGFHRFVLLGERAHGINRTGFVFGRNELLYIWSAIKIAFIILIAGAAIALVVIIIGMVAGLAIGGAEKNVVGLGLNRQATTTPIVLAVLAITWIGMLFVMSRLSLVLPHVALGNPSQLRFIWTKTKGNSWRLMGYFVFVSLSMVIGSAIVMVPLSFLLHIPLFPTPASMSTLTSDRATLILHYLLSVPFTLIWTMLTITMLSVAYREIVGLPSIPDTAVRELKI